MNVMARIKKIITPNCSTSEIMGSWKALVFYRYVSWFLTSVFYLLETQRDLLGIKLVVITSLFVYGKVIIYLYEHSKETNIDKITWVIVETLGIALFLIPTGGLDSPFIWYTLNPIFMTALLLPSIYCWGVMVCFITIASGTSIYFHDTTLLAVWEENHWLLLVFLLLTTVAAIFAKLLKQLSAAYNELSIAYCSSERVLKHNADLYQALETLSYGEDSSHLADLLAKYARKLSGSPATICYLFNNNVESQNVVSDPQDILKDFISKDRVNTICSQLNEEQQPNYTLPFKSGQIEYQLKCIPLQSLGNRFGFLGYVESNQIDCDNKAIGFLAELSAIVMERQKADELSASLMVSEEQNRIANEIHDGVSQYLFSIVYALHGLSKKQGLLQDEAVKDQLALVSNTANKAAKELRTSIYRISPRRRGEQVFVASLSSYLDGLSKLNNVKVAIEAAGLEDALSPALRKALYRIVRESTSNAVRHGKCSQININLQMEPAKVILEILDDGQGFDPVNLRKHGLGLANMSSLMASFKGRFKIQSSPGEGAKVTCVVPDC